MNADMLTVRYITEETEETRPVRALYERAFPENERCEFERMVADTARGLEIPAFYEEGRFCGFACLLNCGDISHIIYFAVEESLRGRGMGGEILATVRREKPGQRLIVDVEAEAEGADNNPIRRRRKEFYRRNGYAETEVHYHWQGDDFEILSNGGPLTNEDFWNFWKVLGRTMDTSQY